MSVHFLKNSVKLFRSKPSLNFSARLSTGSIKDPPAGSIKQGGGIFSEIEQAEENVYFKKLEQEQLERLRKLKQNSETHITEEIKLLKKRINDLEVEKDTLNK